MPDEENNAPSFSSGRRWWTGFTAAVGLASCLALVVMVNYLGAGYFKRFQWSSNAVFKLTPQTLDVLASLTNEVTITVFFNPKEEPDLYHLTTDLLTEYQNACPRRIHVQMLDYTRRDTDAKVLLARLNLADMQKVSTSSGNKNFVLIESNGHQKICYARDLSDYDINAFLAGQDEEVHRKNFKGEMLFSAGIYAVSYPRPAKAYFVRVYGGHDPGVTDTDAPDASKSRESGYTKLAGILKNELNTDWATLSLGGLGTNPIPADCQLLIVAGPWVAPLRSVETEKIDTYLNQGGKMLALLDPESGPSFPHDSPPSGLESTLRKWGIDVGTDQIIERKRAYAYDENTFAVATNYVHSVMDVIRQENLNIRIYRPCEISKRNQGVSTPGAPEVTILCATSDQATTGKSTRSFSLMAAVEKGVIKGTNAPSGGTRILVAGDSFFLDDGIIDDSVDAANHVFAEKAFLWLLQKPDLLLEKVGARPIQAYRLTLTLGQESTLRLAFLVGLPGGVMLLGGLVWLRRRK